MILFTGAFHAWVFRAWWLTSGTSGSRTSRYGVLACVQGTSVALPHPSPGSEVEASVFGISVRALLLATSLPLCMVSFPAPGQRLSVSAFKGCNSALEAFLF